MAVDALEFRQTMSRFAAGVTVVTLLDGAGQRIGFTATAFSSLSLDPPLALVCVTTGRYADEALRRAEAFGVSFLARDQEHLAVRFADPSIRDRFAGVATRERSRGVPVLDGTIAGLVCEPYAAHEGGDHTIHVGRVCEMWHTDEPPLLHFQGAFNGVSEEQQRPTPVEEEMADWVVGAAW